MPIAGGPPVLETATRPTSSVTSGSKAYGRTFAPGEAAKYRTAHEVSCDNATVVLLSLEIGRIERKWVDEATSFPRRARN